MTKKNATITIEIEPELKEEAEVILNELGISTSTIVKMLYKQIVSSKKIPFESTILSDDFHYDDYEEMLKESKKGKTYTSKQIRKQLLNNKKK